MLDLTLDQAAMQSLSVAVPGDAPIIILVQETTGESQEGAGTAATGETAGGTQTGTAAAEKGGMPQLNPVDFPPQLIWLAISFVLLLILMSRVALPKVSSVVELREKRIQSDIERADRVKAEADNAKAAYERMLTDARAKAQAELAAATQSIQAETGKRDAAFMAQLTQRTKAAEDAIAAAKTRALGDVRSVAAEAAASIIRRIAGADAAAAEVASAVDAVSGRRG
jgi:F-type H+-transporting ATPase subunit b